MNLRRDHHAKTYTILVCPYHGDPNVGCCDREPITLDVVPKQRMEEVQAANHNFAIERRSRDSRSVAFTIGTATLFGSRENVAKARAAVADLKGEAKSAPLEAAA